VDDSRVRRFRKKNFFASKQNEAKRDPFCMRFARSREKKKKIEAKQNKRFFALFCFEAKQNKRFFASFHHTRYRHEKVKDQP
jgi:hypothetical protein